MDSAKPEAALWGVMLLRKPANPAQRPHRCEWLHATDALSILALRFTRTHLKTEQMGKGATSSIVCHEFR